MGNLHDTLAADLQNVFFNPNDFGEVAIYFPKSGPNYNINTIFEEAYQDVNLNGEIDISSTHPMAWVYDVNIVGGPHKGDQIQIRGNMYTIKDNQPDGVGVMALWLFKNS